MIEKNINQKGFPIKKPKYMKTFYNKHKDDINLYFKNINK